MTAVYLSREHVMLEQPLHGLLLLLTRHQGVVHWAAQAEDHEHALLQMRLCTSHVKTQTHKAFHLRAAS
jgi:hypothetical protein